MTTYEEHPRTLPESRVGTYEIVPLPIVQPSPRVRPSKHHFRARTWRVTIPYADIERLRELQGPGKTKQSWHLQELVHRPHEKETVLEVTYGPVHGAYDADLLKYFTGFDIVILDFLVVRDVHGDVTECRNPEHQ